MVGHKNDMPAYKIDIPNKDQFDLLEKYWDKHQRRQPGHTYYKIKLHATLKDDQKAKSMEILKNKNEGIFQISKIIIRTLDDKRIIKTIQN